MRIAVVGGGINGLCTAWELGHRGHQVTVLEQGELLAQTSSASTKLLHGGLRYLEHGALALVREALRERSRWLSDAPEHCGRVELWFPVYRGSPRSRWRIKAGLWLYDRLAGARGLGGHRWFGTRDCLDANPGLRRQGLIGGYRFFDGQMDEQALGAWVAQRARVLDVRIRTGTPVSCLGSDGTVYLPGGCERFDRVINATGPWAAELVARSGLNSRVRLDLVRGSHILFAEARDCGCLLQVDGSQRFIFVLPYKGRTLVGTTEVRQGLTEPVECSAAERRYLVEACNAYFPGTRTEADVVGDFAGLRPLVYTGTDPGRTSREYRIETMGRLINVFGGKWTTARALARKVADVAGSD